MRCGVGVSDICGARAVPVIKASVCHHQSCRVTVPRLVGRVADRALHAPLLGARGSERVDGTGRVGGGVAASSLRTDVRRRGLVQCRICISTKCVICTII